MLFFSLLYKKRVTPSNGITPSLTYILNNRIDDDLKIKNDAVCFLALG